jgi:hypothetical protein
MLLFEGASFIIFNIRYAHVGVRTNVTNEAKKEDQQNLLIYAYILLFQFYKFENFSFTTLDNGDMINSWPVNLANMDALVTSLRLRKNIAPPMLLPIN